MKTLRLALAQINTTVGDLDGNTEKIIDYINKAYEFSADVVAFPELCVTGYPPEDLLLKPQFIKDNIEKLNIIRKSVRDFVVIVGFVNKLDDIYNAAATLYNCEIIDIYNKIYLPNYGVFDELRYFQSGDTIPVYDIGGVLVGVNICEDIWYPHGPAYKQSLFGAELIININASPYDINKMCQRETMLSTRASDNSVIVASLNTVGGQDELIFDGSSIIVNQKGEIIKRGKQFAEELIIYDLDIEAVFMARIRDPRRRQEIKKVTDEDIKRVFIHRNKFLSKPPLKEQIIELMHKNEEIYNALVLGTRDYVQKNGFRSVIIGLSGGVDPSFVATIAVDAIGPENVMGLLMPSPYTSAESIEDARQLADNLKIKIYEIPITNIFKDYLNELEKFFKGKKEDITEENLQARIRGNILMAFSNKFGALVLTTGNKSEMSVGYATLYGDMAGGFAVIKDVPKTMVFDLCKWRNKKEGKAHIPDRVIFKEPSAELKRDQKDTDSLPPYEILDPVLDAYIEEDMNFEEMLTLGCETECTQMVINMIDRNEYKRRQSPPGIKITRRAFGKDRRFPITNKYKSY